MYIKNNLRLLEDVYQNQEIFSFLDYYKQLIIVVNTNKSTIYVNSKIKKAININNLEIINKKIEDLLEWDLLNVYFDKMFKDGTSFYSIKTKINNVNYYLDMCPIEVNMNIEGGVVILNKESGDSKYFSTAFKAAFELNGKIESLVNSSFDKFVAVNATGELLEIKVKGEKEPKSIESNNIISDLEKKYFENSPFRINSQVEKKKISMTQRIDKDKLIVVSEYPVLDENFNVVQIVTATKNITNIISNLQNRLSKSEKLVQIYQQELKQLKENNDNKKNIIYKSIEMDNIMKMLSKVAKVDSNILINGETGTGKSIVAETIHNVSNRSGERFVNINCGAIPETLIESELFGYSGGAFSGASKGGKVGHIELANKGTLFLDEIGELPLAMQVKLLKVINEKKFVKVGGTKTISSDFRLITATNKDLYQLVKDKKFREDLYYRILVVPITIPPLRERKDDIFVLVNHFLNKFNEKYGFEKKISPEVHSFCFNYDWPGNVRELENFIERIVVTIDKKIIELDDIPLGYIRKNTACEYKEFPLLKEAMASTEKELILRAYEKYKNTYKVAEVLGVSQANIARKIKTFRINKND